MEMNCTLVIFTADSMLTTNYLSTCSNEIPVAAGPGMKGDGKVSYLTALNIWYP
jgi:hypothetical protein